MSTSIKRYQLDIYRLQCTCDYDINYSIINLLNPFDLCKVADRCCCTMYISHLEVNARWKFSMKRNVDMNSYTNYSTQLSLRFVACVYVQLCQLWLERLTELWEGGSHTGHYWGACNF